MHKLNASLNLAHRQYPFLEFFLATELKRSKGLKCARDCNTLRNTKPQTAANYEITVPMSIDIITPIKTLIKTNNVYAFIQLDGMAEMDHITLD